MHADPASPSTAREEGAYRPDIDGLRAVAVLLVVLFHASPSTVPAGFIGVDVFFVISGYLITGIILRQLETGRFSLLGFYARRFRRIVPALATVLIATWLLGWFCLLSEELANLGKHMAAGAWFVSNILLWREAGYFDVTAELKPLLHLWSLGVEEQYYLIWPLLLAFLFRRRVNILLAIAVLFVISFTLNLSRVSSHGVTTFYLLPTRFWELLMGAALIHLHSSKRKDLNLLQPGLPRRTGALARVTPVLALLLLVACAFAFDATSPFPGWRAFLPTALTGVLILSSPQAWVNRRILSSKLLVGIGLISYPLYLWHWPLLALTRIVEEGQPAAWIRIAAVMLATVLAYVTWTVVEKPIRRLKCRSRRERAAMVITCLGVLALIGGLGLATKRASGFPKRHPVSEASSRDLNGFDDYAARLRRCAGPLQAVADLSWCLISKESPPTLAVYGDSHADHIFPGIVHRDPEESWLLVGQSGCAPLRGVKSFLTGTEDHCANVNELAIDVLARSQSIKTVILSSLGPYYISQKGYAFQHRGNLDASKWLLQPVNPEGDGRAADRPAADHPAAGRANPARTKADLFQEGLSSTVSALLKAGKKVVLYLDTLEIPFMPDECLDIRPVRITTKIKREPCALPRTAVFERQAEYRAIVARLKAAHPALSLFDPLEFLCDQSLCYVQRDGDLYFRDSHHLSMKGSDYLAGPLLERLHAQGLVP